MDKRIETLEMLHTSDEIKIHNLEVDMKFWINKTDEAKKIIKQLLGLYFNPIMTEDDLKKQDKIIEQAKEFIKE